MKKKKEKKADYEYLTLQYIVHDKDGLLDEQACLANNLYNSALYYVRQSFFKHKLVSAFTLINQFKQKVDKFENMTYSQFAYRQTGQQTIKEVTNVFKSWFKALKAYRIEPSKFTGRPKIPKYLKKHSRHSFMLTSQNVKVKDNYLVINPRNKRMNLKLKLPDNLGKIKQVTFKPLAKRKFKVCVQYESNIKVKYLPDNGNYVGIDPGIDNAFVCVNNKKKRPLIINGRNLKSINHRYNKERARLKNLQAQYKQNCYQIQTKHGPQIVYRDTERLRKITDYRNEKVYQFAHKASKRIIDYALSCGAHTIIIGKNKYWKRSSNMGKKNNQNFIGIPHAHMINLIRYKAALKGIRVIEQNESYTSQTSFLDHEKPCWANGNKSRKKKGLSPINRRIHRGLFKTNHGILINADVNGALQIMRKAFPKVTLANGIQTVVLQPDKYTVFI